jgi:hypothetical protein
MPEPTVRLIDKIRINAKASDRTAPTSYTAGLRDAEEFLRRLEALPEPLEDKKSKMRQEFLEIMNEEPQNRTVGYHAMD